MKLRRISLIVLWLSCCSGIVMAQVTIRTGTVLKSTGTLTTNASVNNASTTADLTSTDLSLSGTNQTIASTAPRVLSTLTISGGGVKTLSGNWEVTESLTLNDGFVEIGNGSKLLFSGTEEVNGSDNSFVRGYFYTKGTGRKHYPIGAGNTYAPAVLESFAGDEIGMRLVAGDVGLTLPEGIISYFNGHYWETSAVPGSTVSLSTNGIGDFLSASKPAIVQTGDAGGTSSLGGSLSGEAITSSDPASNTKLVIGKMAEFKIVIHDLITPFTLGDPNDELVIENIELTAKNHVRLIDRWGLVAAEFDDYNNESEFDFASLSPGNYVCLVEFSYPGETSTTTMKGVVTVLKTK